MSVPVPAPGLAPELARVLAAANVTRGGLMVALGSEPAADPASVAVADRMLGDTAQATLARLFVLGRPVEAERADAALAPLTVHELTADGWLRDDGGRVSATIALTPYEDLLLAHDRMGDRDAPAEDVVLGTSAAADTLARLVPRARVESALDVGTGCGVHALLAARHADRVVATDVSERALDFARLSAALSSVDNVEFRHGDLYDPVEGERFDLISCNPPYVISPGLELTYRDGTLGRDDMSRLAVAGATEALAPGGVAVVLVNWIHHPFASWAQAPSEWIEGRGCDALLLHHVTETPLEYAARWNAPLAADPAAYGEALDAWTGWCESEGITSLATGAAVLHRTGRASPLVTEHEMGFAPRGDAGDHAVALLQAAEWLAETSDAALLATPMSLPAGHTLVSERVRAGGDYGEDTVRVELDDSVGVEDTLGPGAVAVLMGIDAARTPADAIPGLSAAVDTHSVDVERLVAELTRGLVARGLLVPEA